MSRLQLFSKMVKRQPIILTDENNFTEPWYINGIELEDGSGFCFILHLRSVKGCKNKKYFHRVKRPSSLV